MNDSTLAYIGLGSNLGEPEQHLKQALWQLDQTPEIQLLRVSSLYRTAPQGVTDQPDFLNAVALLATTLDASTLLNRLQEMEAGAGRVRTRRWGARTLDLDLLLFGDIIMDTPALQLPHPRMHERAFVLVPLVELAPHISLGKHGIAADLLARLPQSGVEWLTPAPALPIRDT